MRNHRKFPGRKRNPARRRLLVAGIAIVGLCLLIDRQICPAIQTIAAYQANAYAIQAINTGVQEQLDDSEVSYSRLISLSTNGAGEVISLQTDIAELNRLQAGITQRVTVYLANLRHQSVFLPLGTLIGGAIFSGRGPEVEIRFIPADFVKTSITNVFEGAGINQTRHQIMLKVQVQMTAIIPGYSVSTQIETDICLAETVVVGLVPEAYTVVGNGTDPLVGLIQDYDASHQQITRNSS